MPLVHLPDTTEREGIDTLDPKFFNDGENPRKSTGDEKLDRLLAKLAEAEESHDRPLIRVARRAVEEREEDLAVEAAAHRKQMAAKRAAQDAARAKKAEKAIAEVRKQTPYAIFYDGEGNTVRVDLGDGQFSREAARVVTFGVTSAFDQRVKVTRATATVQPLDRWLIRVGADLEYAAKRGLVKIEKENTK